MFKYKNDKGVMCIVDTSANKEYRLSMPHEVVEVVAILNAAQQSVQRTIEDCEADHGVLRDKWSQNFCHKCGTPLR